MLFKNTSSITFKWQSGFYVEINTTPTSNLKSRVINNIRSRHYSRTQKKCYCCEDVGFFSPSSVDAGCPKEASFIQLNGSSVRAVKRHWERKNGCWFPGMFWDSLGSAQPPTLPNRGTLWGQLLVVLESIPRAQRKASESYQSARDIPWGAQSLGDVTDVYCFLPCWIITA